MGYVGLLLNAPYKIDSMVWMRLGLGSFLLSALKLFGILLDYVNHGKNLEKKGLKMDNQGLGVWGGVALVLRILEVKSLF
jgi:hypothetical protein